MLNSHYIYSVNRTEYINNIKNSQIFYVIPVWDQNIINLFFKSVDGIDKLIASRCKQSFIEKHNLSFYLSHRYSDSSSIQETIWRIKLHIEERPMCPICGKSVRYLQNGIFCTYCSAKCAQNSENTKNNYKKTCKEKYGADNPAQSILIKEKIKNTCQKKYGVNCVFKDKSFKEKAKQSLIKKYGVDNPTKSKEIKEKIKKTCQEKYGVDTVFESQEIREIYKNNYIKKYGVDNPFKNEEIKNKFKKTCLNKYGVEYYTQSTKYKNLYKDVKWNEKRLQHIYATKKKNNSFNTSKPEDDLYSILVSYYPDVIRQYRSKLYPFNCDFYIPSLDLYIEYNGHWTHGSHPYDPTSQEDIDKLNLWISKQTEFYGNAIRTWTISDPLKRKTAQENNLNYLEIWNKSDIENIINTINE